MMRPMRSYEGLPNWPRLLSVKLAALYLGISVTKLNDGWRKGEYPAPLRDGSRILWDIRILDHHVDMKGGMLWVKSG